MGDMDDQEDFRLAALATLAEPLRRRLYLHVASQHAPVGRDAAAAAAGVPRSVAAFHLDKLAEAGLLEVEYRRPEGRRGPGAGRPAKLYRRAALDVSFAVPARRYDVVAELLARAVTSGDGAAGLATVAREEGRSLGAALAGSPTLDALVELMSTRGYEPVVDAKGEVVLHNCPFRALAEEHRDLVCGMNLELVQGVLEGAGARAANLEAHLEPAPGCCCVVVRPAG